ncbi:MAG: hypothetical protein M3O46_22235 [Myxococcota bacterium]|nr:hypothetical protein [Myxococcota bacterium]
MPFTRITDLSTPQRNALKPDATRSTRYGHAKFPFDLAVFVSSLRRIVQGMFSQSPDTLAAFA